MKIPTLPFTVTDWSGIAPTVHPGETGQATWRSFSGDLRVRLVEYTAGYVADHWCDLGHVLYVIEGQLDTELRDGPKFKLLPGNELSGVRSRRCGASFFNANGCQALHR